MPNPEEGRGHQPGMVDRAFDRFLTRDRAIQLGLAWESTKEFGEKLKDYKAIIIASIGLAAEFIHITGESTQVQAQVNDVPQIPYSGQEYQGVARKKKDGDDTDDASETPSEPTATETSTPTPTNPNIGSNSLPDPNKDTILFPYAGNRGEPVRARTAVPSPVVSSTTTPAIKYTPTSTSTSTPTATETSTSTPTATEAAKKVEVKIAQDAYLYGKPDIMADNEKTKAEQTGTAENRTVGSDGKNDSIHVKTTDENNVYVHPDDVALAEETNIPIEQAPYIKSKKISPDLALAVTLSSSQTDPAYFGTLDGSTDIGEPGEGRKIKVDVKLHTDSSFTKVGSIAYGPAFGTIAIDPERSNAQMDRAWIAIEDGQLVLINNGYRNHNFLPDVVTPITTISPSIHDLEIGVDINENRNKVVIFVNGNEEPPIPLTYSLVSSSNFYTEFDTKGTGASINQNSSVTDIINRYKNSLTNNTPTSDPEPNEDATSNQIVGSEQGTETTAVIQVTDLSVGLQANPQSLKWYKESTGQQREKIQETINFNGKDGLGKYFRHLAIAYPDGAANWIKMLPKDANRLDMSHNWRLWALNGIVGSDGKIYPPFSKFQLDALEKKGITKNVAVDFGDENMVISGKNATRADVEKYVDYVLSTLRSGDVVVVQGLFDSKRGFDYPTMLRQFGGQTEIERFLTEKFKGKPIMIELPKQTPAQPTILDRMGGLHNKLEDNGVEVQGVSVSHENTLRNLQLVIAHFAQPKFKTAQISIYDVAHRLDNGTSVEEVVLLYLGLSDEKQGHFIVRGPFPYGPNSNKSVQTMYKYQGNPDEMVLAYDMTVYQKLLQSAKDFAAANIANIHPNIN